MLRRLLLAGLAGASLVLAAPAPASAQAQPSVLRYSASAEPRMLDPVVNWLAVTHEHAYLVYDNLFALDADFRPQPQMVDKVETSADGTVTTLTLRPGLAFHDGSPVTSADAIASIARWAKRDTTGRRLVAMGLKMEAVDAATFRLILPRPTPLLIEGLAKPTGAALFIMRQKEAETEATTAVKEIVGSGPFRWVAGEYRPGHRLVYDRNPAYRPRPEAPSNFAGGRDPRVDRVEWIIMPDSATAVAALQNNELDYYESPPMDLVPLLRKRPDIRVAVHSKQGAMGFLRFNLTQPPFDKPEARRALAMLMDQPDFMAATSGGEQEYWRTCFSFTACGGANEAKQTGDWLKKPNLAEARALFQKAGYDGTAIAFIAPGDNEVIKNFAVLATERMRQAGLKVDLLFSDFGAMIARRANRGPASQGGWNMFPMWSFGAELDNPVASFILSADCSDGGYAGWACDKQLEALKEQWMFETNPAQRSAIIEKIQAQAEQLVPIVPLGQFFAPVAYRTSLSGVVATQVPVFWNIQKR
jgi:peptide/nickel transport system substrate-binding protein